MIVPCDTDVDMSVTFGSGTLNITAGSYIIGTSPNTDPNADLCIGVFATVPDGSKQSLLDSPVHHSHVEQQPG